MTGPFPDDPVARGALELATGLEHPAVLNHSLRTFLQATRLGAEQHVEYDRRLLFCACVLHDVGTADAYDGDQRFEVDGADAAARYLTGQGLAAPDVDQVWEAIALHTSPHIAERRGPVTMLTRLGVLADFSGTDRYADRYPRLDIERVLADAVVAQALRNPGKAPAATWPASLVQAQLEGRSDGF